MFCYLVMWTSVTKCLGPAFYIEDFFLYPFFFTTDQVTVACFVIWSSEVLLTRSSFKSCVFYMVILVMVGWDDKLQISWTVSLPFMYCSYYNCCRLFSWQWPWCTHILYSYCFMSWQLGRYHGEFHWCITLSLVSLKSVKSFKWRNPEKRIRYLPQWHWPILHRKLQLLHAVRELQPLQLLHTVRFRETHDQ